MLQEGDESPFDNTTEGKGDEIQKLSVIETLSSLLADDRQSCIQRLIPKIQQTLPNASTEFHLSASSTFKTILNQKIVNHSTFTQTFLQIILSSLDSRDPVIALAWLETLLDVIELLPADVIRREILPVSINKGQLSQSVSCRIMSCKLIGKICTRFDSQLIKKEVLPSVHSLCQDVNSDVRACICLQLRFIAEKLGAESVKSTLLSSIVELASDEESSVRHAAVQTIVYLLPHLQTDVIKTTISPLIKKCCDNALKSEDSVLCILSLEFGKLSLGLEKCLTSTEKVWLLDFYKELSQLGVTAKKPEFSLSSSLQMQERYVECRQNCAYNLPAMFLFVSKQEDNYDNILPIIGNLTSDSYHMVRRKVACGIYEIIKLLGAKNILIKNDLIKLIKDDNEEVLAGLVPHIGKILQLYFPSPTIQTTIVMDFGRALIKCENELFNSKNWRLNELYYQQLEILPKCFSSDYIYTYFIPIIFDRSLNARPIPIKLSAGKTLLILIRYNMKLQQRTELRNKLINDFARNNNSYIRMQFLRIINEAINIFSSYYLKEYFFMIILNLTEDPIANVRLKAVTLLPILKTYIRLPSDKKLLSSFESCIRNLMNNEKDRDVTFCLTRVIHKLDEIDVKHEGQPAPVKINKQDSDDFKKFEEEKKLLLAISGKAMPIAPATSLSPKKNIGRSSDPSSSRNIKQNSLGLDGNSKITVTSSQKTRQPTIPVLSSESSSKTPRAGTSSKNFDLAQASSMPEIPIQFFDDEYPRTTDIRIPTQISSPRRTTTKIPNINDMMFSSSRTSGRIDFDKNKRSSVNFDKGKTNIGKIHRLSMNLEEQRYRTRSYSDDLSFGKDELRTKRFNFQRGKSTEGPPKSTFSVMQKARQATIPIISTESSSKINPRQPLGASRKFDMAKASSMPEIPVDIYTEEYPGESPVQIVEQASAQRRISKIPNINDVMSRNARLSADKIKRSSLNLDRGKTVMSKSNRLSMIPGQRTSKIPSIKDMLC